MMYAVFSGGGGGSPLSVMASIVMTMMMVLLMVEPIFASINLNLTLNMVLAPQHQTQVSFGSAVGFWRTNGRMNLVVGAPLTPYEHNNINYPLGNIFLCTLKGDCEKSKLLPALDLNSREALNLGTDYFQQMGVGFGETISFTSSNEKTDSILLVCAPRFPKLVVPALSSNPSVFMSRGACFKMANSNNSPTRILPFHEDFFKRSRKVKNTEKETGFGMAGFEATLTKDETVFMGCPNTFYGQGSLSSWNIKNKNKYVGKWRNNIGKYRYNKYKNDTAKYDYNREGWALALGKFSDDDLEYIATSVPLEDNTYGQIKYFSKSFGKIEPRSTIEEASTHGFNSFYGYALAVGDLNQDTFDDLIVGAPLAKGKSEAVEGGKVFIYYGPLHNRVSRNTQILEGQTAWSRFGTAVVSADFNHDGYYDVAVGAPYGKQGWGGAVYIYMGGPDGLCTNTGGNCLKPDLLICASDFSPMSSGVASLQFLHSVTRDPSEHCKVNSSSPLLSLGYSLATADVDDNGYPDLLIGAPNTDKALLVRSAPVVVLVGNIFFEPKKVLLGGNKTCAMSDIEGSEKVICFKLKFNINYEAHRFDVRNLGVVYTITLDHEVLEKRILFLSSHESEHTWKGTYIHRTDDTTNSTEKYLDVYVKPDVVDSGELKPITAKVTVQLADNQQEQSSRTQEMASIPPVLFNPNREFIEKEGYLICEDNATCFSSPNVKIMELTSMVIVVNGEQIKVHANISIEEDFALGFKLNVTHPWALTTADMKLKRNGRQSGSNGELKTINETLLEISVGGRIKNNTMVSVELDFKYESEDLMKYLNETAGSKFDLNFSVTTSTLDTDISDNKATLTVEADTNVNLTVTSNVDPETNQKSLSEIKEAFDNSNATLSEDHGPIIDYKIVIKNNGPAFLYKAEVFVELPQWFKGSPVFYLTEQLMSENPEVKCDHIETNLWNFSFETDDNDDETDDSDHNKDGDTDETDYNADKTDEIDYDTDEMTESGERNDNSYASERKKRNADIESSSINASLSNITDTSLPNDPQSSISNCNEMGDCHIISKIDCAELGNCQRMRCTVDYLAPDKDVIITLKNSRILYATLLKLKADASEYQVYGRAKVVTHHPGRSDVGIWGTVTHTVITIKKEAKAGGIGALPWWYLLLAILGGVILIIFFSYCLYKAGFFKRNRPPTGSKEDIVESDKLEPENVWVQDGVENTANESTPLNKRKEMDSDDTLA